MKEAGRMARALADGIPIISIVWRLGTRARVREAGRFEDKHNGAWLCIPIGRGQEA